MADLQPTKSTNWVLRILIAGLTLVFLIAGVAMFGGVAGEEFSPQKFTMRRFYYWQIPLVGVQVWPVQLTKIDGDEDELALYIRRNKLHGDVRSKNAHWDIMMMDELGAKRFRGNASILTQYLRQPGATGMQSWLDWTKKNPKSAAVFWPIIATLAEANLYPVIPSLMEAARKIEASDFENEIRALAAKEVKAFSKAEGEAGEPDRVASLDKLAEKLGSGSES